MQPPLTVYLDQNKWIDLTHALVDGDESSKVRQLAYKLIEAVKSGRLLFPLSGNLLIETYRMENEQSRSALAEVQAKFSQGWVVRDRSARVGEELKDFILRDSNQPSTNRPVFWWLSRNFIEAWVPWKTLQSQGLVDPEQLEGISADPKFSLYHWISTAPASERHSALEHYTNGSADLIGRIAQRRNRLADQSFAVRKRVYATTLAVDEFTRICAVANNCGLSWKTPSDIGSSRLRKIFREVPTYSCEIELAARIEMLERKVESNDLRDMQGFVASVPYCNVIVGEKLFVNLALQANLNKKHNCQITTDLFTLESYI